MEYESAVKQQNYHDGYLSSILQARQLVFLSNVCIWKLCWLAVALSGLMLDLQVNSNKSEELSVFKMTRFGFFWCFIHWIRATLIKPNYNFIYKQVLTWISRQVTVSHFRSHNLKWNICNERCSLCNSTHMAMSNCSIHFLFVSSVLQKNWKPCFPCRWIR